MTTPTLTTGEICRRLGLSVSSTFIADKLGVPPRQTSKHSFLWHETDMAAIRTRLARYVEHGQPA